MAHLRARDDAVVALSSCLPGQQGIVWYSDDNVYHERLLVWKVNESSWYILTPDNDLYVEDWSCKGGDGPISFKIKGDDFRYFSRISQPVYRFSTYPTDEEFKEHVKQALQELGGASRSPNAWRPQYVLNMAGRRVEATEYLGRLLTPTRIRGKDGGRVDEPQKVEADVSPVPATGIPDAPEGKIWIFCSVSEDFELGAEASSRLPKGVLLSESTGAVPGRHGWSLVQLVAVEKAPAFVEKQLSLLKEKVALQRSEITKEPVRVEPVTDANEVEEAGQDDARTLSVQYDDQGERYKPWREATRESREYGYPDWPHEGPQTVLHLMKHMLKNGGSPKQWLQLWGRQKGIHENDRVMHEMRSLMDCMEHAACYDQLNLPCLASMETVGRRVQSIVDAYQSGSTSAPDWGAAKIISGYQSPEDLVMPQLRSWAAKRGKEEVELAAARTKIKEHKKLLVPVDDAAAAIAEGNLPAGAASGKPKRKAKAKTLAAPGDP